MIYEGLKIFPDLIFPIDISRETLPDAIKLIKIESYQRGFLAILPLINRLDFEIHTLIPIPVQVANNHLMIASVKDLILKQENNYITVNKDDLIPLDNSTWLVKDIEPIWSFSRSSCELEALTRNITNMLQICPFTKLGSNDDIFLTDLKDYRVFFTREERQVDLNCPDGKIKTTLVGIHQLSNECDIETDLVRWPAKLKKEIKIENLLKPIRKTYDITKLRILTLNGTEDVHKTIKDLIDRLPSLEDSLTIDFSNYDWTLEQVQSYSIYAHGITTIIIIINSTLIIIIYILKGRDICRKSERISTSKLRESVRSKMRNKFPHSIRDSVRDKFRNTRDSLRRLKQVRPGKSTKNVATNTIETHLNYIDENKGKKTRPSAPALHLF